MEYHKEIGEKVRVIREKKKKTQEKFAEELGISPSYLGKLERGQKNFTIGMLYKIAEKNNISVANLLCDENELLQCWEFATKDLKLKDKQELLNVLRMLLKTLNDIIKRGKI